MTKFKSRNGLLGGIEFTDAQGRIMSLLEGGEARSSKELREAVDGQATNKNLSDHLLRIRKLIRGRGIGLVCVYKNRRFMYQLVRLISTDDS